MSKLNNKQFHRVFVEHMLSDVRFCIENGRHLAAAQLLLASIDTVAGMDRPANMPDTTSQRFIDYGNKHLALEGENYTLRGIDLWGARNGFLHGYTPVSSALRKGQATMLVWVDNNPVPVQSNEDNSLVVVSLRHLAAAHSQGIKALVQRASNDDALAELINQRLDLMFTMDDIPDGLPPFE